LATTAGSIVYGIQIETALSKKILFTLAQASPRLSAIVEFLVSYMPQVLAMSYLRDGGRVNLLILNVL